MHNTKPNRLFKLLLLIFVGGLAAPVLGEAAYTCLSCHTGTSHVAVHAIFNSSHANLAAYVTAKSGTDDSLTDDKRNLSCVACHGSSSEHQSNPLDHAPEISFGPRWQSSAQQKDEMCMACHDDGDTMLWHSSVHQREELACTSCHELHTQVDPVLQDISQAEVCMSCHTQQRSQLRLPSHHPIAEGETVCGDCHNAHGSTTEYLLKGVTLNDTCFSCHAEKRGPFLFEHAPVQEDCSTCHEAHGTVHDNLLSTRGPFLCQQCHSASFHPSVAFSGDDVSTANKNVVGKNCLNCHSQVHGSNHPSGAYLTR